MNTHDYASFFEKNKNSWNRRTSVHVESEFYNMRAFLNGENTLNAPELELLGDVSGKSILHLQCHFGQDSISLARMGANVTAVDLSDASIQQAKKLSEQLNVPVEFICCNVYDAEKYIDKKFDIVFTSYGTIGWLPDLNEWARLISAFLKPGGEFIFAEFHPVVWMFDNDFKTIGYSYFNSGPIIEQESGTYADRSADLNQEYIGWNHSLSEVINSLAQNGLGVKSFSELDYSPYNCFRHTFEFEKGKFRIAHLADKIPMMYTLKAIKK